MDYIRKIIFFIIAANAILLGCKNNCTSITTSDNDSSTTNKESEEQEKLNMPEILFENTSHHFGTITQGEQLSYIFYFKNVGNSDLVIYDIEASCGCTRPIPSKEPVKSGESGEIAITVNTEEQKVGERINYIVVIANTFPAKTILTLHANVQTP